MKSILAHLIKQRIIDACPKNRYMLETEAKTDHHLYYKQEDDGFKIPKRYRWRTHNQACRMTPNKMKVRNGDVYVTARPRIQQRTEITITLKDNKLISPDEMQREIDNILRN